MTARRPRHPLLRAIPLATLACAGAAAACGVASSGPQTSARAPAAVDTATHTTLWEGRVSTTKNLPDGTTRITLGPDPASAGSGTAGFGWRYRPETPVRLWPGDPLPRRSTVYPEVVNVTPGSPAEAAGLRTGDVILSSNGVDGREFPLLRDQRVGAEYTFRIRRGDDERDVRLVLARRGE
jgi:membrane-associated protease RseP (regulator of RpoE activity)